MQIQKNRCAHCKTTENLEIDYLTPISQGGKHHPSNFQILCSQCNQIKATK